ncbi:hypothetical protein V5799_027200 [Amblyomma americanum]|uniref:Uncharacterized protein n=1 Tax=Amblyomma americanum TaxID=6943 RepID=A0AAQ4DGD9_AMBAM
MESATNESAPSANAATSVPSSSSSGDDTKSVSHDWTTSSGSKACFVCPQVDQDTSSSSKKKSAHSALVLGSPSDLRADEELHQSARAATVGIIAVLALSMLMLLLHVGRRYLEATTTEVVFENYSIVVPETELRTAVTWPTLKETPFRPPVTEGENSTMEEPRESLPEDSPSNVTELTRVPTLEELTDYSSPTPNVNSSAPEKATESIAESNVNSATEEPTAESTPPPGILVVRA